MHMQILHSRLPLLKRCVSTDSPSFEQTGRYHVSLRVGTPMGHAVHSSNLVLPRADADPDGEIDGLPSMRLFMQNPPTSEVQLNVFPILQTDRPVSGLASKPAPL
jgi:hypothetical protein